MTLQSEGRKKFDELFRQITDTDPDNAEIDEESWIFMPLRMQQDKQILMGKLCRSLGPKGWKNNPEGYGYFVKRPD
jgi:hypothetical protein